MTGKSLPDIDWQAAAHPQRLSAWMDEQGLESGELRGFERLTGGTQNLIVRFQRGNRSFVLRRPPLHPRPDGDKTILREARVLGALAGSRVPHPGLIAFCADTTRIGSAFYLMEPVEGFNPSGNALPPRTRRARPVASPDGLCDGRCAIGPGGSHTGAGRP